jgi:4-deoxy-L-threo-5-hexosulose-uronate ketol-isomerase
MVGDIDIRYATHPTEMAALDGGALRARFLLDELFVPGSARLALSHHDRLVVGGILTAGRSVPLRAPAELSAAEFCDRREVGIVCLAGPGTVTAGRERYEMEAEDLLYLGAGTGPIAFAGDDAAFYLVSAPAHSRHPAALARRDEVEAVEIGDAAHANLRTIRKYVHAGGIRSCQLAMGITTLEPGSVWNTMPCHTHERRTEVYLYFDLPAEERVIHVCGRSDATRSIVVADRQAVISPPWSVHFGAGTSAYRFVWATAGENLAYDDMDRVATSELR